VRKIISGAFIMMAITISSCSSSKKTINNNDNMPSVDEIFSKMDANKDGKLSKEEVRGPLQNDFAKIDTDGDGFISKEELNKAPKPKGQRPPQSQGGRQQGSPPNGGN
jgi:Ca2+-binding EF-hand superfamily protein